MTNLKLHLALFAVCLIASCSRDNSSVYPASIGNQWVYHVHSAFSTDTSNTNYEYRRICSVIKDTTINNTATRQFLSIDSSYQTGKVVWQNCYYVNNSTGFYLFGLDSPSVAGPEFKNATTFAENFPEVNSFKTNNSSSVFIINAPIQLLKFPIVQGDVWRSEEYGVQADFKRKYIGQENITTPAGSFSCTKLLMFQDGNNDNQPDTSSNIVYEWYCDKGFIMRTDSFVGTLGAGTAFKSTKSITLESFTFK